MQAVSRLNIRLHGLATDPSQLKELQSRVNAHRERTSAMEYARRAMSQTAVSCHQMQGLWGAGRGQGRATSFLSF